MEPENSAEREYYFYFTLKRCLLIWGQAYEPYKRYSRQRGMKDGEDSEEYGSLEAKGGKCVEYVGRRLTEASRISSSALLYRL